MQHNRNLLSIESTRKRDLTLKRQQDPEKGLTQLQDIVCLCQDEQVKFEDLASSQTMIVDDLGKARRILNEFGSSSSNELVKFEWL